MLWFLEENNLRLDNDVVKKIVNKLKKVLPEKALFGINQYGVHQIARQNVEKYNTVGPNNSRHAYYDIEIEYAIRPLAQHRGISQTSLIENIIYLTEDNIYALDIPDTKSILDELDIHFVKYTTQDEVKLSDTYEMESKLGGKYRVYSFKDLKKEFVDKK